MLKKILIMFLLMNIAFSYANTQNQTDEQISQSIKELLISGKTKEAMKVIDSANEPDKLAFYKGATLYVMGNKRAALNLATTEINNKTTDYRIYLLKGQIETDTTNFVQAFNTYGQCMQIAPANYSCDMANAILLNLLGDNETAIQYYNQAEAKLNKESEYLSKKINPENIYYYRALSYLNKPYPEPQKAISDINKYKTLTNKESAELVYFYGYSYQLINDFNKSIFYYEALENYKATSPYFYLLAKSQLCELYYNTSNTQKAYDSCALVIKGQNVFKNKSQKPVVKALLVSAQIGIITKKPKESMAYINKAIQIDPNNGDLYFTRALINNQLGNLDQADKDASRAKYLLSIIS